MFEVGRWESTVTAAEGIDMGIGVGFFGNAGSGAIVCLLGLEMVKSHNR